MTKETSSASMAQKAKKNEFEWAIVGGGPAGIAAVGKLIDSQIDPHKILWIDPTFAVGDFGAKWHKVPSNTSVELFIKFLHASPSFEYKNLPDNFELNSLDVGKTCELSFMVSPLQAVTKVLRNKVNSRENKVVNLVIRDQQWQLDLDNGQEYFAKNVVLAVGAQEKTLSHSHLKPISLDIALNREKLASHLGHDNSVAVFGSSHSAILIIRNLLEACSIKKVINFYQSGEKNRQKPVKIRSF